MTFPLYIFLIIYFVFLLGWLIFSFIAIYHMFKYGFLNFTTFFTIFIYIAVSFLMLAVSYKYLSQVDWQMNVTIFGNLSRTFQDTILACGEVLKIKFWGEDLMHYWKRRWICLIQNFLFKQLMLFLYRLPGKLPEEKIIKVLRRDVFILIKKILFFVLLLILPLALFYLVVTSIYPDILYGQISYPIFVLVVSFYYLWLWVFFFFSFIDYYLDIWIITSERIINIEQQGFFARTISEQRLYRVQDVTSEIQGFFPTIFKYGNVYAQTAGAKERFFFHEIPNPDQIRDIIIKLVERSKAIHHT